MRPKYFTVALVVADPNGYCADQTTGAAADLVLNGQLAKDGNKIARFGVAAKVRITSDGDDSGIVFTIYGTNSDGNPHEEKVTGPSSTTADTTKTYRTVDRVAIDGATTGNIEVGLAADDNNVCVSQTLANAGNLIINGVAQKVGNSRGVVELEGAQLIKITSAGNDSGRTFTIYGRDINNVEISQEVTGSSGGTATSTTKFARVNRITTDAATAGAVTIGTPGNLDNICETQTPGGAGSFIFDGERCSLVARHVTIEGAGDNSGITFTIEGENRVGDPISEVVTGVNNGTATSQKNFRRIYTIRASAAVTGNVEIGTADSADSKVVLLNFYLSAGISILMKHSSDADFTHEFKYTNDPLLSGVRNEDNAFFAAQNGPTGANEELATDAALTGFRIEITNFVAGSLEVNVVTPYHT